MKTPRIFRKAAEWIGATFGLLDVKPWRYILGESTYTGRPVTIESALGLTAVWGCIRLLCETVACLPIGVYERQKDGRGKRVRDHTLDLILATSPNQYQTPPEFLEAIVLALAAMGNSISQLARNGAGDVVSIWPLPTRQMRLVIDNGEPLRWEQSTARGVVRHRLEDILHIRLFGEGPMGLSPIAVCRNAIAGASATDEYTGRSYGQGMRPSGAITTPALLNPQQREQARRTLITPFEGLENAGKTILLEGGFDYKPISLSPKDAEFVATRKFQVGDIARIFRVPPHMIGDLDRATFSNIEHQSLEFVTYSMLPYLRKIEAALNRACFPAGDRSRFFVKFEVEGLLRGDSAARSAFYSTMVQNGLYSRNEARAKEDLPPVDGGDVITVQVNLIELRKLGEAAAVTPDAAAKNALLTWLAGGVGENVVPLRRNLP